MSWFTRGASSRTQNLPQLANRPELPTPQRGAARLDQYQAPQRTASQTSRVSEGSALPAPATSAPPPAAPTKLKGPSLWENIAVVGCALGISTLAGYGGFVLGSAALGAISGLGVGAVVGIGIAVGVGAAIVGFALARWAYHAWWQPWRQAKAEQKAARAELKATRAAEVAAEQQSLLADLAAHEAANKAAVANPPRPSQTQGGASGTTQASPSEAAPTTTREALAAAVPAPDSSRPAQQLRRRAPRAARGSQASKATPFAAAQQPGSDPETVDATPPASLPRVRVKVGAPSQELGNGSPRAVSPEAPHVDDELGRQIAVLNGKARRA